MGEDEQTAARGSAAGRGLRNWSTRTAAAATFALLFVVYLANGRCIGTGDSAPAAFLAAALAQGDAPTLDRYASSILTPDGRPPYWAVRRNGHLVSLYPLAPAVLAAPLFRMQISVLDAVWPSWRAREAETVYLMGKNVAALFAALTGAVLLVLLRRLGAGRDATAVVVAATLGSEMWVVGSQSLWQHGPSTMALAVAMLLVLDARSTPARLLLAGLAAGLVFACRIPSTLYVLPLLGWVALRDRRRALRMLAGMLPVVAAVLAYNMAQFGDWSGGIHVLESRYPVSHATAGRWAADLLDGLAGTFVSPGRGLLVYCPWVAVAVATLPWWWRRLAASPGVALLASSLLPSAALLGSYSVWWGGYSFGPRFWTDATPVLALLLWACLAWARERAPAVRAVAYAAIAASVLVQAVGAFCFPSSWNGYPAPVDRNHARLWDWSDSELVRCLREGPHPAAYDPFSPSARDSALGILRRPGMTR